MSFIFLYCSCAWRGLCRQDIVLFRKAAWLAFQVCVCVCARRVGRGHVSEDVFEEV